MHELTLLASGKPPSYLAPTAALVVAAALVGYLMARLKVVPIVGFLLAGVLIGPAQLGLVSNSEGVQSVADIGVILLLFTIGIEFSLARLARAWRYIVIGGLLQVTLATLAGLGLTTVVGGGIRDGIYTGFLLALSSTAVVLKLLAQRGESNSTRGRLALSLLIAQDLAVVAMVLVVPQLGATDKSPAGGALELARAVGTAVVVVVLVIVVARRAMPPLLDRVARTCSPEVFLLAVVAICFGTAYLTSLAGVSVSLGAFLAGLMVSESRASTQAFSEVLPLQVLFSAAFFVSVGMLLDLGYLVTNLPLVLAGVAAVLVLKVLTTSVALIPLRVGWRTALATALLLAQVGEFSFVLLTAGDAAGLAPLGLGAKGTQAVVATTVLLMLATPLLTAAGARLAAAGGVERDLEAEQASGVDGEIRDHVLIIGWGPTALDLAATLRRRGVPLLMTTLNPGGAGEAEEAGHRVLRGDPTKVAVLTEAGVAAADLVVVAEDDPETTARVVAAVRPLTHAPIVARPMGEADVPLLAEAGADHVVDREAASRVALTKAVLMRLGHPVPRPMDGTFVDTSRVVRYPIPSDAGCGHATASQPVLPRGHGCTDCLREGTEWVHLRICLTCGNVGCCDSSPKRHARRHAGSADHPLIASVEPGETWAYCFVDDVTIERAASVPLSGALPGGSVIDD